MAQTFPLKNSNGNIGRMKAATMIAPGRIEIKEVNIPEPKADEIRIRMEGCGLCSSNIPVWEGREWFQYPLPPGAPGHEGWGHVDALGEGITQFQIGDRVAALGYASFAEYDLAKENSLVKLPLELNNHPFPGEPLGCVMNIFKRSDIRPDQTVAIIGIGFLGALLTQLCIKAGAHVIALSRRPSSLELAKEYGAHHVLPLDDHWKIIEQVKDLTENKFCQRVIEATGEPWPLDLAGELTGIRGKMIIAGYHQGGLRHVNIQLWNWKGLDVINAHERDPEEYIKGINEAILAIQEKRLFPDSLYTHIFPLEKIQEAFQILHQRGPGLVKVLIQI